MTFFRASLRSRSLTEKKKHALTGCASAPTGLTLIPVGWKLGDSYFRERGEGVGELKRRSEEEEEVAKKEKRKKEKNSVFPPAPSLSRSFSLSLPLLPDALGLDVDPDRADINQAGLGGV